MVDVAINELRVVISTEPVVTGSGTSDEASDDGASDGTSDGADDGLSDGTSDEVGGGVRDGVRDLVMADGAIVDEGGIYMKLPMDAAVVVTRVVAVLMDTLVEIITEVVAGLMLVTIGCGGVVTVVGDGILKVVDVGEGVLSSFSFPIGLSSSSSSSSSSLTTIRSASATNCPRRLPSLQVMLDSWTLEFLARSFCGQTSS